MATIQELIQYFPKKYICVRNTTLDEQGLIISAEAFRIYDTLELAKDSASEIRKMMKKYKDFDIIYGDYEDYCSTRLAHPMKKQFYIPIQEKEKLTQTDVDNLLNALNNAKDRKEE